MISTVPVNDEHIPKRGELKYREINLPVRNRS